MNLRPLITYFNKSIPYLAPGIFLLVLPITHSVALRLLMLLITLLMATAAYTKGDRSRPPCLILWLLWLGAALFSLITAVDLNYSIGEIKTEIGYGVIALFSFYVLTRGWRDYVVLSLVMLAGFWLLGSAAAYMSLSENVWVSESFYGGVGDFSSYQITLLPILFLLAYQLHKYNPVLARVLGALTSILFVLLAYKTQNLMVWVTLALQLLSLLFLDLRGRVKLKLILGLAFFGLALSLLIAVGAQKSRISSLTPQGIASLFTQDARIQHWQKVTAVISQQPFRGDGFGRDALGKAHPEMRGDGGLWHSHNIFLDAAVQTGLQGALVLALLFGCLVRRFYRFRLAPDPDLHAIGVVGLVLLVGVLSKNMTDNFFHRHLSLMFWSEIGMLFGLARGLLLTRQRHGEIESSPTAS